MSREIHLTLSGESERTFRELRELGLSDHDILSRALWVLRQVYKTRRVALLKPEALSSMEAEAFIEEIYTVVESAPVNVRAPQFVERGRGRRIPVRDRVLEEGAREAPRSVREEGEAEGA